MPSRGLRLPANARPPAAVVLVGGLLTAVIAVGHPPAARVLAAEPPTQLRAATVAAATSDAATDLRAARVALVTGASTVRTSRSHTRTALADRRATRAAARPARPAHAWVRPNYGPLTSPFGYRWGRLHAGIDLAGPYGSPILAATDGCITYAGPESGYGEVMKITDWDGTETVYGHMSAFVRTSGCVKAGQVIARVGAAGDATGAHLHFEVHVGGVPIDPIPFLAKRGVYV